MKNTRSLTAKIFIGLLAGIALGMLMHFMPASYIKEEVFVDGVLAFVGGGFIRLLMMVLVPVVFTSLACGTASLDNVRTLGRIGSKTILFYMSTTICAICIALAVGLLINPGVGVDTSSVLMATPKIADRQKLIDVFLNIIPNNPIDAMAKANMLQIIVFAIFMGLSVSVAGEKGKLIANFLNQLNDVFLTLATMIMNMAPYGVFALVCRTFSRLGYSAMIPLGKYIGAVIIGLILHTVFVYGGLLKVLVGVSVTKFLKNMTPVISVIFSTASSAATLPVTLDVVEKRLGVSNRVASFTIPLGATVNMDGTAIMQGVAAIFISQLYGIPLSAGGYLTIIVTATLASIGTAGVPGSGLIMLSMVLTSVGLPIEGIAMIMGIDRIVDMCRSTINILGDAVCTLIVAKQEGEFDEKVFYDENLV